MGASIDREEVGLLALTRIKNLTLTVHLLVQERNAKPPKLSKRLHRQVLGLLHPDRAPDDEALRKKLERCFQEFSVIKFTFPADE